LLFLQTKLPLQFASLHLLVILKMPPKLNPPDRMKRIQRQSNVGGENSPPPRMLRMRTTRGINASRNVGRRRLDAESIRPQADLPTPASRASAHNDNGRDILIGAEPPKVIEPSIREFTVFGKLPAEIRIKIWKLNLAEARIITLDAGSTQYKLAQIEANETTDMITKQFNLSQKLLKVSHEARDVVLRSFNACVNVTQPDGSVARILFNSADTLFINVFRPTAHSLFTLSTDAEAASISSNIKHLALHERNLYCKLRGKYSSNSFLQNRFSQNNMSHFS
jgi:hypothetical protein